MMIDNALIEAGTGLKYESPVCFEEMGLLNVSIPKSLSFIESERFLQHLGENEAIEGVFVLEQLAPRLPSRVASLICDDPRYYFYALYNYRAQMYADNFESKVDSTATIHPTAYIAERNVVIGEGCVIEANATILSDVVLGANCFVRANSVLGCDDAEVKKTSRGILRVVHDGKLILGDNVDVGANCTLDKGFKGRDTIIGDNTKLANTTYIGHSAKIGKNCMLLCCTVLGSTEIGDGVRVNPSAVISNQLSIGDNATVSLGAIVVESVPAGGHVSGNFAISHQKFLYHRARMMR